MMITKFIFESKSIGPGRVRSISLIFRKHIIFKIRFRPLRIRISDRSSIPILVTKTKGGTEIQCTQDLYMRISTAKKLTATVYVIFRTLQDRKRIVRIPQFITPGSCKIAHDIIYRHDGLNSVSSADGGSFTLIRSGGIDIHTKTIPLCK